jgi:HSP20 family protein
MLTQDLLTWTPAIDLQETEQDLILKAEVPGVRTQELQVHIDSEAVIITGEHKERYEEATNDFFCQELHHGRFERIIPLPMSVRSDRAIAELIDGILTVTIPKIA